ncbi:alpha/beta fold hydrolase [Streptomyces sp. NPDC059785]|uniref:alpha/beta fold hydrolase n=1 Tax=unclassified Streptomyces TaxID=2593676 RepID=UPI00365B78FA
MATFVLVPGAWLGAWAWEDTARALREHGHTAWPMTLTGLAERAGQGAPDTDLDTHIADITGFVERNDLRDVTLAAHGYAGAPVTGAAARLGDRLERVVHVDSAPFTAGMRMLDLMPPEAADQLRRQVDAFGDGWRLPVPPLETLGPTSSLDGLDEDRRDALRSRATPQPFGT